LPLLYTLQKKRSNKAADVLAHDGPKLEANCGFFRVANSV